MAESIDPTDPTNEKTPLIPDTGDDIDDDLDLSKYDIYGNLIEPQSQTEHNPLNQAVLPPHTLKVKWPIFLKNRAAEVKQSLKLLNTRILWINQPCLKGLERKSKPAFQKLIYRKSLWESVQEKV